MPSSFSPTLTILCLDQSTEATGVAVITCGAGGCAVIAKNTLRAEGIKGDDDMALANRLRIMRHDLSVFLTGLNVAFDMIAYEQPFAGARSTGWKASPMCLGAFLTLPDFHNIPVRAVMRQAACKVAGCSDIYRESVPSEKVRKEKRKRLKAAVIEWARNFLGLTLADDDDAIADACAVGVACWVSYCDAERTEDEKAAQMVLLGKGSRKPKAKQ